jgi:hypothetical protein
MAGVVLPWTCSARPKGADHVLKESVTHSSCLLVWMLRQHFLFLALIWFVEMVVEMVYLASSLVLGALVHLIRTVEAGAS